MCQGSLLKELKNKCELKKYIEINQQLKFSFWYYMYGTLIGTLELKRDEQVLWSKTGKQKNEWLFAEVFLEPGSFQVLIFCLF